MTTHPIPPHPVRDPPAQDWARRCKRQDVGEELVRVRIMIGMWYVEQALVSTRLVSVETSEEKGGTPAFREERHGCADEIYMPCGSRVCPALFFPLPPNNVRQPRGLFQTPFCCAIKHRPEELP